MWPNIYVPCFYGVSCSSFIYVPGAATCPSLCSSRSWVLCRRYARQSCAAVMLAHQYSICLTIALGRLPWCLRVSLRARRLSASSPRPRSRHHNLPARTCVPPSSPTCPPLACIYARPLGLFWLDFSNGAEDHLHLRARHLHHPAGAGICTALCVPKIRTLHLAS